MMSEKSNRTVRSKIPRFQGTRKKTLGKTETVNTKTVTLDQRAKELIKPDRSSVRNVPKVFVAEKSYEPVDVGDVPFELDNAALTSILTNRGIVSGVSLRTSEIPLEIYDRRLTMRKSLNDFKEAMKSHRNCSQYESGRKVEVNQEPEPVLCEELSTAVTPKASNISPGNHLPRSNLTFAQSLEKYKKSVKDFREKMQSYDNDLKSPGSQVFSEFTPRQRQMADDMRLFWSVAPKNNAQKEGEEYKENTSPTGRRRQPAAFSTSKKNVRFYDKGEPNSGIMAGSNEKMHSAKVVKRPLLPSLLESEETERALSTGSTQQMLKESSNISGRIESVAAYSSTRNHLETPASDQGLLPGLPTTVFCSPLFMPTNILKSSCLVTTPVSTSSMLRNSNTVNPSQYSCPLQESLNTPSQQWHRSLSNASGYTATDFKTPTTIKVSSEPDVIKLSNPCTEVAENAKCTSIDLSATSQINKLASSCQPLTDISDCFNRLSLAPKPSFLPASQTGSNTLQNQFPAGLQPHQQTAMPITPAKRILLQTPKSPFMNRPPMRVPISSSCLTGHGDGVAYSPNYLPLRTAATSAKHPSPLMLPRQKRTSRWNY